MDQSELLSIFAAHITARKEANYPNKDNMELLRTDLRSRKLDKIVDPSVLEELRRLLKMCCSAPEIEDHWLVLVQNYMLKHTNNHTNVPAEDVAAD